MSNHEGSVVKSRFFDKLRMTALCVVDNANNVILSGELACSELVELSNHEGSEVKTRFFGKLRMTALLWC